MNTAKPQNDPPKDKTQKEQLAKINEIKKQVDELGSGVQKLKHEKKSLTDEKFLYEVRKHDELLMRCTLALDALHILSGPAKEARKKLLSEIFKHLSELDEVRKVMPSKM